MPTSYADVPSFIKQYKMEEEIRVAIVNAEVGEASGPQPYTGGCEATSAPPKETKQDPCFTAPQ